jgi:hypothetical protein
MGMEIKPGDIILFRKKVSAWENEQTEWRSGVIEGESNRCYFIRDATGEKKEYWKHRIEIKTSTEHPVPPSP